MRSPTNVLSSLLVCLCIAVPSAHASGAGPEAAASAAIDAEADQVALRFEREQRELAEFNARSDAYWAGVGERLLLGQASPGECPPSLEASTCLLAARLLQSLDRPRADALLRSAAVRSLDDPQALWMLARGSLGHHAPELADRALAELRRREPENLLVWLHSLSGERWTPERLQMAARSSRYDGHLCDSLRVDLGRLAEFAADALLGQEAMELGVSVLDSLQMMLFGYLAAEAFPAMQPLFAACSFEDAIPVAAVQPDCWQIAERLVDDADSLLDLALGSALMRRSGHSGRERERSEQARSEYEYLQMASVDLHQEPEQLRAYLRRLREDGATELSAVRAGLVDAGLPESAPPSWRAPSK